MNRKKDIAELLLEIGAIKLQPKQPFKFTSGMISPIYIDNRLLISFPMEREIIIDAFSALIQEKSLGFEVLAGVATAGIHWTAWLAQRFSMPMIYIRNKAKSHGRQNQIEGLLKKGKKTLIIEDHITTGGSSIAAVKAVREVGGIAEHCIAITTYDFQKAQEAFNQAKCRLHTLIGFSHIIKKAAELGYIKKEQKSSILSWNKDPETWARENKFL